MLRVAAVGLLLFLGGLNVYRAWSQSITVDEARTYLGFVEPPLRQILTTYEANHHVLHSLMCKASTTALGPSEFSLRIPSLLGGFLYFAMAFLISRRLFGSGWIMLLCVSLLALNKMVLDFCSAARGYSLALGFYLAGFHVAAQTGSGLAAGCLLGLAIASNLTFLTPVAALNVLFFAVFRRFKAALAMIAAEIAVAGIVCAGPLVHARMTDYRLGYSSIFEALKNFTVSGIYEFTPGHNLLHVRLDFFKWLYPVFRYSVLILLVLAAIAVGQAVRRKMSDADVWMVFSGGGALLCVAQLIALHRLFDVPYPMGRTAIYFWPLMVLFGCLLIYRWREGTPIQRGIAGLYAAFFVCLIAQFAMHISYDYYDGWLHDAGSRKVAQFIRSQPARGPVSVTSCALLLTALSYYREIYGLNWLPMEPWHSHVAEIPARFGDYVVTDPYDPPLGAGFELLYSDQLSGARVYRNR